MKRLITTMVLALAGLTLAAAQTTDIPAKPDSTYEYEPTRAGDKFIHLGLGVSKSLFNMTPDGMETDTNINFGGSGSIWYAQYLTSHIALGGEIDFRFNTTLGENLLFTLPVMFKASWVGIYDRIQVPVSLASGMAFQAYNGTNYFGLIIKPEIGVYYQYSPDYSFGVLSAWNIIPQWYKASENNRTGNMLDLTVGFRYHF